MDKQLEEFGKWCALRLDCDYREGAWDAWQARQPEIDAKDARIAQLEAVEKMRDEEIAALREKHGDALIRIEQERAERDAQEPVAYRIDYPNADGVAMDRFFGADATRRMNNHLTSAAIGKITCEVVDLFAKPMPPAIPEGMIDAIMEQAQVFASAYHMVGGRFDKGNEKENCAAMKDELRAMLIAAAHKEVK